MAINRTSAADFITARTRIKWKWASPKQYEAFLAKSDGPILLSGGFGAGKTLVWARRIIMMCDLFPGSRWVIIRSSFEHLKKTTMPTFFGACPPEMYDPRKGGKRVDSDKYVTMTNGSTVLWMHLEHPNSIQIVKGLEINGFMIDQAEDVAESTFDLLMGRLGRWKGATVPPALIKREVDAGREWRHLDPEGRPMPPNQALLTVNPDSKLHWIYRRFHPDSKAHYERSNPNPNLDERAEKPRVSYADMGYKYISMKSTENRYLPKSNLGQLLSKNKEYTDRFVDDVWGVPKGTIHAVSELSLVRYSKELVEHLMNICPYKYRVLDHGDTAPTACTFWVVDPSGNLWCYQYYSQPNRLISYHRKEITRLSGMWSFTSIADPAIFNKTMQNKERRYSVHDVYSDTTTDPQTALYWLKGNNDELGIRDKIGQYLEVDPTHRHPVTHLDGAPRIFFLMAEDTGYEYGCEELVTELGSQRRKALGETPDGEIQFSEERDDSVPDHGYDTIRYMVGWRPATPSKKEDLGNPHGTFEDMVYANQRRAAIVPGRNVTIYRGPRIIT